MLFLCNSLIGALNCQLKYYKNRAEVGKFRKTYCPQMKLGSCHKNKILLEKEKEIKNAPIFAKMHLKKSAAPLKVKNLIRQNHGL